MEYSEKYRILVLWKCTSECAKIGASLWFRQPSCNWGKLTQNHFSIAIRPFFVPKRFSSNLVKNKSKRMVRPFVKISLNQYEELNILRREKNESLSKLMREALSSFSRKKGHCVSTPLLKTSIRQLLLIFVEMSGIH
jgi:hypothetical protein